MKRAERFCRFIDLINEWSGRIVALTVLPMLFMVGLDVTLRYIFNKPTIWVWDVNIQILAVMGVIGAGYTLLHKGHVVIDVLVTRLSAKKRAVFNLITTPLFFIGCGFLLWKVILSAIVSIQSKEVYTSVFSPPLYPLRVMIVVGVFLLLLQAIANFIRDLNTVIDSKEVSL